MSKYKVDLETAEQEVERFADSMGLNLDTSDMDEEDLKGFEVQHRTVVQAIREGGLVINEDGEPVYTPQRSKDTGPITFHEPGGSTLLAQDRRKSGQDVAKTYTMMAELTGEDTARFSKLKLKDVKVCTALFTLFMGG